MAHAVGKSLSREISGAPTPSATGSYGRLADEIQAYFENFKIGCRLKYSSFRFVYEDTASL